MPALFVVHCNIFLHLWILEFEVVLKFIDVYQGGDRNTLLYQDHMLFVEVNLFDRGSEVDTGLGNGKMM